ncbi:anthranilate synthase component I [Synechocystis sp. PCC 7338]|uniref:anthranilate synthase component I n=1 Tax=Synechocystis sp. PCC 7338 TaxID=2732530 RepID=UPI001BAEED3C|nr:anthranilate synthase component I [Synechocystis sp. PCC 7338]QUS61937.1 anthranilate synthase component I [Synechocystis sp. PCC 7338]
MASITHREGRLVGAGNFGCILGGSDRVGRHGLMEPQPWHWCYLPLQGRTGSEVFSQLFGHQSIATLLESPYPPSPDYPHLGRYSICAGEPRPGKLWTPSPGQIFSFLHQLPRCGGAPKTVPDHLPFHGGWLGWLGYDTAWAIETLPYLRPDHLPFPVAYWYEPEDFAVLDHREQLLWLATTNQAQAKVFQTRLSKSINPIASPQVPFLNLTYTTDQDQYETMVNQAQQYIKAGDIFQANLTLRFIAQSDAQLNSWQIYRRLQAINPSPFASYWRSPWGDVVSCSPERLVKLEGNVAQTRPIAGTRARGKNLAEDEQLLQELLVNTKELAEHIMLVDLERNDLGRVCTWGTVEVDELLAIERYSHVSHLVSNVRGILQPGKTGVDLVKALFPGGTISGCPKVRCLEVIEELEPVRRSLFYGSCGYWDQRGNLDLNILIRTLLFTPGQVIGQVGAGIVADSDPTKEWLESLQKAKALLAALDGVKKD